MSIGQGKTMSITKAVQAVIDNYRNGNGPNVKYSKVFEEIKKVTAQDPFAFAQFGVLKK